MGNIIHTKWYPQRNTQDTFEDSSIFRNPVTRSSTSEVVVSMELRAENRLSASYNEMHEDKSAIQSDH